MAEVCPDWVRDFNLWSDKVTHTDPYPRYAELREHCPVAWSEALGGHWIVTRHADIVQILQDPESFSSVTKTVPAFEDPLGVQIPGELDGLEHTRYRQAVLAIFSPDGIANLEPTARLIANRLLDDVRPPSFEFVHEFAIPFVFDLMMHMFGIDPEDHDKIRAFENGGLRKAPHDHELTAQLGELIKRFIVARREQPPDRPGNVLDHLAVARYDDRLLTLDEALRLSVFLLKAGLHTTVNALGNTMSWLADHPETRDRLVKKPDLLPSVLEELMRFESILVIARTATRDTRVHGQEIREGDHLLLLTGSAGRDESVFSHPDTIDFDRENIAHLMFGVGPHRCLGRHLARLEITIALEEIHRRIPTYRADPDRPAKRYTAMSRGARELFLVIGDATTAVDEQQPVHAVSAATDR
jgi:cytochrome P450